MVNSFPPIDSFGSFVHKLTEDELPRLSHNNNNYYVNTSQVKSKLLEDERAGFLCITPEFKVSMKKKPHPKHLHNMKKSFGWTWENV